MNPVVSVIVPVYNAGSVLKSTIDSILGQSLLEIELIIVDDGSTDGLTSAIISESANDRRVRVLAQENQGVFVARNTGLRSAQGEYVYFCDQDDRLHPQALECLVWTCRAHSLDFISFWNSESSSGDAAADQALDFASLPLVVASNDTGGKSRPEYLQAIKAVRLDVWAQFATRKLSMAIPFRKTFDISRVFKLINASKRWAVSRSRDLYVYNRDVVTSMSHRPYVAKLIRDMHVDLLAVGDEFQSERAHGDANHIWQTVRKGFLARCLKMQVNAIRRQNGSLVARDRQEAKAALAEEIRDLMSRGYVKLSDFSLMNAMRCAVIRWMYGRAAEPVGG